MFESAIQFLVSAAAIVIAGTFLVRSADSIGDATKIGKLMAGSIFLAGATSLPELFVDISAVRKGLPDIAVGDLLGSSLFNLLILAIADLLHKSSKKIFSKASSIHTLSAAMSINVTAIAGIALVVSRHFPNISVGELGLGPLMIAATYLLGLRLVFREQRLSDQKNKAEEVQPSMSLRQAIIVYSLSAITILIAAPYLADAAGQIAKQTGLGETFVGTTLVALSTSLPELVSTVTAVRMGAFDLAIGNIFGSNCFNMILLLPLDFLHEGPILAAVSTHHVMTSLAVIFATSVAVMGQVYQVERRGRFVEPDAAAIILIVLTTLTLLHFAGA